MSPSESTAQTVSESGVTPGPGQRLREAREAAELSLAEIATRLHLDRRTVAYLERDEYDKLPAATFVRGYLSGYARLLDLPKGPIMEAYERHGHAPPSLVPDIAREPQVRISDLPMRMVTYLISGLLVVLVVLWWQHRQSLAPVDLATLGAPDTPTAEATSAQPESQVATAEPAAIPPVLAAVPAPVTGAPAAADGSGGPAAVAAPTVSGAAGPAPQPPPVAKSPAQAAPIPHSVDLAAAAPAPAKTVAVPAAGDSAPRSSTNAASPAGESSGIEAPATRDSGVAGAETPRTDQTDSAAPALVIAALPGSDVIAIRFTRESWVEIYDRGGARLYYSLAQEGSEVVVTGAGPMRVLLGAVDGAAVTYNGEHFDLTPFRGRTVARFTVGREPRPIAPAPAGATDPAIPGEQATSGDETQPARAAAQPAPRRAGNAIPMDHAGSLPAVDTSARASFTAEN